MLQDGSIPIKEGVEIELEDGVRLLFTVGDPATQYRTGDYWLIPARVATGDVEWPQITEKDPNDLTKTIDKPKSMPPNGVEHHYAPRAAVTLAGGTVAKIVDLRHKFAPLGACIPA